MIKIIIADDEPILRSGIVNAIDWQKYGFEIVAQASNGVQVLNLIKIHRPNLIITDIVMPIMDGVTLAQKLSLHHPQIQVLVLSSFSEFNYVRECFKYGIKDYLLKPEITPEKLLFKIQSLFNDYATNAIKIEDTSNCNMHLYQTLETEILSLKSEQKMLASFTQSTFCLVGFSVYDLVQLKALPLHQIEQDIANHLKRAFLKQNYAFAFFKDYCYILFNTTLDESMTLKTYIAPLTTLTLNTKQKVHIFYSQVFKDITCLIQYYKELQTHLINRIYFKEALTLAKETFKNSADHTLAKFNMKNFLNNLELADFNTARQQIDDYFIQIKRTCCFDEYTLKKFTQNIVYTLINLLEAQNKNSSLTSKKILLFKQIDITFYIDELQLIIANLITEYQHYIANKHIQYTDDLVINAMNYINKHYTQNIKIRELAEYLHINYSYFSTYFKSHTGQNITSYINQVRITEAKRLLVQTDMMISHVGTEVGYSDHNYFSKVFKKITKLTPNAYRKKYGSRY